MKLKNIFDPLDDKINDKMDYKIDYKIYDKKKKNRAKSIYSIHPLNNCFYYKFIVLALFLLIISLGNSYCSENKQETLLRLSRTIAQNSGNTKELKKIQNEITERITDKNSEYSLLLAESDPNRIEKASLDGSSFFWIHSDQEELQYIKNNQRFSISLNLNGIIRDINPSWSGKYLVIYLHKKEINGKNNAKKKKCFIQLISIIENKNLKYDLPDFECGNIPAIDDKGEYLFYSYKNELHRMPLGESSLKLALANSTIFSAKHFVKKYKKVKSRFVLQQVKKSSLLIFFGNAGYYNLSYHNGQNNNNEKLITNKLIFARPQIYSTTKFQQSKKYNSPDHKTTNNSGSLYKAEAFAYTGSAGKYKLHALEFGEKLIVHKGFSAPAFRILIFLQEQGRFLSTKKQKIFFWNPTKRREKSKRILPLAAKNLFLSHTGFVYTDLLGQLYLRKVSFSNFESSLLDLYGETLSN